MLVVFETLVNSRFTNDSGSQDFAGSKWAERIDQATKRIDLRDIA